MKKPNIAAIIQARMTSTRFPGKILKKLHGKTVLERVLLRCRKSTLLDKIIVASPDKNESMPIKDIVSNLNFVNYIEGDEHDVLKRYWVAANEFKADIVVRITSDCPLVDGGILDTMLNNFLILNMLEGKKIDYYSNVFERTFPRGFDIEIFTFDALNKAYEGSFLPEDREHVTRFMYTNPNKFNVNSYKLKDIDLSKYRLTLDTQEDFDMFQELFRCLDDKDNPCLWEIAKVLKQYPHISSINSHIMQKKS